MFYKKKMWGLFIGTEMNRNLQRYGKIDFKSKEEKEWEESWNLLDSGRFPR